MTTRTLTRAELHILVWTHPPREVARRLGVTLGELDRLLQVMAAPYPYSGYWSAPESASRAVPRLPNPPPGAVETVEITPVAPPPRKPKPSRSEAADPPTAARIIFRR